MEDREVLLNRIARSQRGVFTMAQGIACGLPRSTITSRVAIGRYEAIHPGVYGLAGSEDSWHRKVTATVFSAGSPAAASHRSAAYIWGMTSKRPTDVEISTKRYFRRIRDGVISHESKDLRVSDIVTVDGVPVTSAVRTVVDLGASSVPRFVELCLDSGLRRNLFTAWQVRCFIARVARPGRNGVGTIRPLIEERLVWDAITDSDLEDLARIVIKSAGCPMPESQHPLYKTNGNFVGRYDFAYPQKLSIIEADSLGYHMDPVSFERDRQKQNEAIALGWSVYRITWRQLIDDPESVRAIVRKIWAD